MSEVKRPKLISFGSQKVNNKSARELGKTLRIAVVLPESTEDKCPEFNYKDLCIAVKKKETSPNNISKQTNGLDPFNEDDEDVKRIAAEMEAKYGIGVAKKRKWRKDDYADIGMGYDESDSFIDNTDGYDEIIPKNVTTVHGGFYINCGALEFKTDEAVSSDESSSSEDEVPEKDVHRKRVIESSPESEEEDKTDPTKHLEKKQKLLVESNGMQNAIKKRLFSHEKIKQIRTKRLDENKKTVRELLKEKRDDLNMSVLPEGETPEKINVPAASNENNPKELASVVDVIESVISGVSKKKIENVDESSKDSVCSKEGVNHKSANDQLELTTAKQRYPRHPPGPLPLFHMDAITSSESESNDGIQTQIMDIVQLPENLPTDIVDIIDTIKKAAVNNTEGKVKFFSDHINGILLSLERKCRCLGKQSRMKVYEHLAPFVKCRKETLIKRAKNLCVIEEQKKIKILLNRLKSAVGAVMPPLIASYESECQTVLQRKFCSQEDASKNLKMPKRQFVWNDEIKKLVKDIITLRRKCYINEGKQKDTLEKNLIEFMKTEIYPIWPDGWISMNTLLKYCGVTPQDTTKKIDSSVTPLPKQPPDIVISPSPIIMSSTPSSLPISSSPALTITPVTQIVHKVSTTANNNEVIKIKPKSIALNNETIISKVITDSSSNVSKASSSKPLPSIDVVKTLPSSVNSVKYNTTSNSNKTLYNNKEEIMVIEDTSNKKEPSSTKPELPDKTNNHCQIIDLTDGPDVRKKPGPKSKTKKYLYDFPDKPPKLKAEIKSKDEITGSSALNQIIADSLGDFSRFTQTAPSVSTSNDTIGKKISTTTAFDYSKARMHSEGDDIQKVMEGLKVLQKMSSPAKISEELKTSSPVSVIAFNKSYANDSNSSSPNTSSTAHNRNSSFQDAFQKQFIPDYHLMKASHPAVPSKGAQNSVSKHNHASTKSSATTSDRYLQNSNNNFSQQNPNKLKNSQQSGSYNMLDDMYANFLSEYGFSKTATSNPSSQHK